MKKILILISLLLIISGCYNYKELNNYAIVTAISIDKAKKGYEVSIDVSNYQTNDEKRSNAIYSGVGKTIDEAFREIELILPKEIYIGHLSILLISDEVAKDGIDHILNYFLQKSDSQKNFFIALSKDCKAKSVLATNSKLSQFPSQNLTNNIKITKKSQGSVSTITFNSLLYKLVNDGTNPTVPSFEISDNNTKLSSLGIFKEDKLVSWASEEESIGINILNNNIENLNIKINNESFDIQNLTTTKKVNTNKVDINIKAKAISKEQINNPKIKKNIESEIKQYVLKAINKAKDEDTDIFNIGLIYYQNYPNKFNKIKNWNEYFKNIEFKIKINVDINPNNLVNKSIEGVTNEKS